MAVSSYFFDFDRPFQLLEREFFRPDIGNSPLNIMPRDFYGKSFNRSGALQPWGNIMRPMEQLSDAVNRLAINGVGSINNDKFEVNIDVQHFSPEEINVKVVDRNVIVEGKHDEKCDDHGYISRRFVRRYALPEGCLPDTVQSKLSSDGVLTVTAPKVIALPSTGERIVPIMHTGPIQAKSSLPGPAAAAVDGVK